jgi:hypothetical protein
MSTAQLSAEISHDDGPVFLATLPELWNRTGPELRSSERLGAARRDHRRCIGDRDLFQHRLFFLTGILL